MSERKITEWKLNQGLRLLGIILTVYVILEYVLPVIFPFCVGFLLAALLVPVRRWLERRLHMRREAAGFFAFFLGLVVVLLLLAVIGKLLYQSGCLIDQSGVVDRLYQNGYVMWDGCCQRMHQMTGKWLIHTADYPVLVQKIRQQNLLDIPYVIDNWKLFGSQTLRLLAGALVTLVSTLLILTDFERISGILSDIMKRLFPGGFGTKVQSIGWTYVRAQIVIMLTVMGLCVVGLFLAGEKHALGIGIAIGVCDALPFLGTGICFLPWALWQLLAGRYLRSVWLVVLYLITSFTRQMLEPRLIGRKIGVPPLAVLISVYLGVKVFTRAGFLLGPLAAFLIWQLYMGKSEAKEEEEDEDSGRTIRGDDSL